MAETKGTKLPQVYTTKNEEIYSEEKVYMKDFVIGALVGGIVGAAAGLLLAPKAGRDLREDVAIQAVSLKDKSIVLSSTAMEKTAQFSSQIKEQSTHLVDKVKGKSTKMPSVFDDGTVSSEGEEPLDEIVEPVSTEEISDNGIGTEQNVTQDEVEDMSEISRPSSI